MGSHGGASGSVRTQNHESRSNGLARQGSLYSLTFDEVQNQLGDSGKPLVSMNLDELLMTVSTVGSSQGMGGMDYGANSQHSQGALGSSLQQQSSAMVSSYLNKKTVGEVWHDIQQGLKSCNLASETQERQATLGEMTLEDFLVKAGVIPETFPGKNDSVLALGIDLCALPQQQAQWTNYQVPLIHQPQQHDTVPIFMPGHPVQQHIPIGANPMMDVAYPDSQMTVSPSTLMGTLPDTHTPGRKRFTPGDGVEEPNEKRLRIMIRNRDSAARSRARKQVYIHELENKVSRLKEENERLKRQQKMDEVLASLPMPKPKNQLRRTSSAPF